MPNHSARTSLLSSLAASASALPRSLKMFSNCCCTNARTVSSFAVNDAQSGTASAAHSACRASSLRGRSEEHTSELQSLMRISYAVFCLKKKNKKTEYEDVEQS